MIKPDLSNYPHPTSGKAYETQCLKSHRRRILKYMKSNEKYFPFKIRKKIMIIYDHKVNEKNILGLIIHPSITFLSYLVDPEKNLKDLTKFTSTELLPENTLHHD